jgi:hypothetical protein
LCRTSYRKLDLGSLGGCDLIAKLRASHFWAALKANAVGPNPINTFVWPNEMITELTAAKNAFGHQASDGVCEDGNSGLCVCKQLMAKVFQHAQNASAEHLLRVVAANLPCGIALNFRHRASALADAIRSLFQTHANVLSPFDSIGALVRKRSVPAKPKNTPHKRAAKLEDEPAPKKARQASSDQFFYSASIRFMQSRYSQDGVRHMQAGVTIGGVDPAQLIAAMSSIFKAA